MEFIVTPQSKLRSTVITLVDGEYVKVGTATLVTHGDFRVWEADDDLTRTYIGEFDTYVAAIEAIKEMARRNLSNPENGDDYED
jgi:hypothetical protein